VYNWMAFGALALLIQIPGVQASRLFKLAVDSRNCPFAVGHLPFTPEAVCDLNRGGRNRFEALNVGNQINTSKKECYFFIYNVLKLSFAEQPLNTYNRRMIPTFWSGNVW
jgi:hypothetical protein